jgi:hypothetical protein
MGIETILIAGVIIIATFAIIAAAISAYRDDDNGDGVSGHEDDEDIQYSGVVAAGLQDPSLGVAAFAAGAATGSDIATGKKCPACTMNPNKDPAACEYAKRYGCFCGIECPYESGDAGCDCDGDCGAYCDCNIDPIINAAIVEDTLGPVDDIPEVNTFVEPKTPAEPAPVFTHRDLGESVSHAEPTSSPRESVFSHHDYGSSHSHDSGSSYSSSSYDSGSSSSSCDSGGSCGGCD